MNMQKGGCLTVGLLILVLVIASIFAKWSVPGYSEGARTGELIKFSRKGVICKTWEGSIMTGETADSNFDFTVMDGRTDIIDSLQVWIGKKIKIKYEQQFVSSKCKSETNYYPTKIKRLE